MAIVTNPEDIEHIQDELMQVFEDLYAGKFKEHQVSCIGMTIDCAKKIGELLGDPFPSANNDNYWSTEDPDWLRRNHERIIFIINAGIVSADYRE